jgi:menaquinone-dependent protoporphyrinogen oxidase
MARALVVFASTHGQTEKIAHRLADAMTRHGLEASAVDVRSDPSAVGNDVVVVGGSIHVGHHQRRLTAWAKRNLVALDAQPSAFFSVCLAAAEDTDEAVEAGHAYVGDFAAHTGWVPDVTTTFAGALRYLDYGFFTRTLMRIKMRRGGQPSDVSQNFEYTDWDAVHRFAEECSALAAVEVVG